MKTLSKCCKGIKNQGVACQNALMLLVIPFLANAPVCQILRRYSIQTILLFSPFRVYCIYHILKSIPYYFQQTLSLDEAIHCFQWVIQNICIHRKYILLTIFNFVFHIYNIKKYQLFTFLKQWIPSVICCTDTS